MRASVFPLSLCLHHSNEVLSLIYKSFLFSHSFCQAIIYCWTARMTLLPFLNQVHPRYPDSFLPLLFFLLTFVWQNAINVVKWKECSWNELWDSRRVCHFDSNVWCFYSSWSERYGNGWRQERSHGCCIPSTTKPSSRSLLHSLRCWYSTRTSNAENVFFWTRSRFDSFVFQTFDVSSSSPPGRRGRKQQQRIIIPDFKRSVKNIASSQDLSSHDAFVFIIDRRTLRSEKTTWTTGVLNNNYNKKNK